MWREDRCAEVVVLVSNNGTLVGDNVCSGGLPRIGTPTKIQAKQTPATKKLKNNINDTVETILRNWATYVTSFHPV